MRSKTIPPVSLIVFVLGLWGCAAMTAPEAKVTSAGGPTIAQAQLESYSGPKARIAVARFTDKTGKGWWSGQIGDGMADMLATALFHTNRFIVLEREVLGDVLAEQDLAAAGRVRRETAAPIGLIEGAELLVAGAVTEFEPGAAGTGGVAGGLVGGILGGLKKSHIAIDLRIIDAKTSRVLAATSVEGSAKDFSLGGILIGAGVGVGLGTYSKTPVEKAIRVALGEAVNFIVSQTPAQYFHYEAPAAAPTPPPAVAPTPAVSGLPNQVFVAVTTANIRSGPGTEYGVISSVRQGEKLTVLGEKEDWYNVELPDGKKGWIYKELAKK
jgi:curli biogenesis system outer membrane secretion channel CsgG